MKAIIWDGRSLGLRTIPEPTIDEKSCRVRVSLAGVCATDLEITKGYLGFQGVLGHEFVGVVEQGPENQLGKRVVADINCGCGQCPDCLLSDGHHCQTRSVIGIVQQPGAFAESLIVPTRNLVEVPESLSDEAAVFSEPLAAASQILDTVDLPGNEPIIVLGDGRLGLLIAGSLASAGYEVELVGRHPERSALYESLGVSFLGPSVKHKRGVVVEATGNPSGFQMAIESVRPKGTLILKSTYAQKIHFDPSALVIHEIRVIGSRCGSMKRAVRTLADGPFDPRILIDSVYPLDDGVAAIERAAQPGVLKVLIRPA